MAKAVAKRAYRSPLRQQQALATRTAILDSAQSQFERAGYSATTIEAIATEAQVSAKTVYLAFVSKSALLRAVWERALLGEDATPIVDTEWYRAMLDEPDPRRQLELSAAKASELRDRIGPLLRAIRSASFVDPDGAELWQQIQAETYANQRTVVEAIARHGGLRPGLDIDTAVDIMWTLNHPDVWLLLTGERSWSTAAFEQWFKDAVAHHLLKQPLGQTPEAAARTNSANETPLV